jgi:hypothetical protein
MDEMSVRLAAVAALGGGGGDASVAKERKVARQQRKHGGRTHVVKVRLDDVEAEELARRAAVAGVTGPRYLVESALVGDRQSVSERRALMAAFMVAKRQVAGAATNLNQLAKVANSTGKVPVEVMEAAVAMDELGEVLGAAADRLTGPGR